MLFARGRPNNASKFLIRFSRDGLWKRVLINGLYRMNCQSNFFSGIKSTEIIDAKGYLHGR